MAQSPHPPSRHKFRTAFRNRERRYPIWSARAIIGVSLIAIAITAVLVFALGRRSPLVELEITFAIVAAGLFLLLSIGLYRGARVKKQERVSGELEFYDGSGIDASHVAGEVAGAADDPLGCLMGAIVGFLLSILLVVLIVVFVNLVIIVFFLFIVAVGWIFHRALRTVFSRSKQCRGDILKSLGYAALYTFLYTGWLLGILLAAEWIQNRG